MEEKRVKDRAKIKRRTNLIIFAVDVLLIAYLIFIIVRSMLG